MVRWPDDHAAGSGDLQRGRQAEKGSARARRRRPEDRCGQASDARWRDLFDGRSQEEHDVRRAGQGEQRPHPADGPRHDGRRTNRAEQRRGRVLRRGRGRYLDRRLALRPGGLHARYRTGDQSAGVRSRHGGIAGGEHAGGYRIRFRGIANFRARGTTASATCRTGCRRSWTFPSRRRCTSTAWSRAGSTASRASAKPASAPCRARSPMRSTMRAACGFASIPSRGRRSWRAC